MACDDKVEQRMRELWNRYLPQQMARLETVSRAIQALQAGELSSVLRHQAAAEAHSLVGSLGTFGLPSASDIAQELEFALRSTTAMDGEEVSGLLAAVIRLRREIEHKE